MYMFTSRLFFFAFVAPEEPDICNGGRSPQVQSAVNSFWRVFLIKNHDKNELFYSNRFASNTLLLKSFIIH